ncbi:MAG: Asp23/Gls24 family envelope stress response protein [Verrucomicrobia bacterium]|jgi:uncharacterized alkaline shock family protein YloU|nr:Asp23/Gls24 family envelope stress response protein [Verrucomicrobiota bacterium]
MAEEPQFKESTDHLETLAEDSGFGSISINNEVVANIVAMAAKEVTGVAGLASGGIKDDLAGLFGSRRESGSAVSISETGEGAYRIGVKLVLTFGVQLAKVAQNVQVAIREQVENMTNKEVARVDVIVDGVHRNAPSEGSIPSE